MARYVFLMHEEPGLNTTPSMSRAWLRLVPAARGVHDRGGRRRGERGRRGGPRSGRRPRAPCAAARATLITDGPFTDTKEALGGLYVIEAPDFDVALHLAVLPGRATSRCAR